MITTGHWQEVIYGLPKSCNCDDLGCIYFKVICRLQSFSNGMFCSCISTDKCVTWSLCNSRSSCPIIASYLSKVAYFSLSHLHLSPPLGWLRWNMVETLGVKKARVPELSRGVVCVWQTHTHTYTDW